MRDILIEPPAKRDLAEAIAHYDQQRAALGLDFLKEVKNYLQRIAENPRLYAEFRRKARKAAMSRFPYVIVYMFDSQSVYVLAVMHGSRNPQTLARRIRPTR